MPWDIRRDLHIDIDAAYGRFLLTSATNSSLRQPAPDFIHGDKMPVRFHFWTRNPDGTLTAADPGPSATFVFTGRPAGAPTGSDLLFLATDFAEFSTGIWEATLDLNTAELAAHLAATPVGSKIILGELEVRDAANTIRHSLQFDLTARPQCYDGEAPPLGMPVPMPYTIAPAISRTLWGSPNTAVAVITGTGIPDKINGMRLFVSATDAWSADGTTFASQPIYAVIGGDAFLNLYSGEGWRNLSPPAFPAARNLNSYTGGAAGTVTVTFSPYPAAYPGQLLHDGTDFYRWNAVTSLWDALSL